MWRHGGAPNWIVEALSGSKSQAPHALVASSIENRASRLNEFRRLAARMGQSGQGLPRRLRYQCLDPDDALRPTLAFRHPARSRPGQCCEQRRASQPMRSSASESTAEVRHGIRRSAQNPQSRSAIRRQAVCCDLRPVRCASISAIHPCGHSAMSALKLE